MTTWGTKVEITTNCPECGEPFSRETYLEGVIVGSALELCPKCVESHTDEHGNWIRKPTDEV